MKTQIATNAKQNESKINRVKKNLFKATEEVGAWLIAGGFFYSIVWLTGNIFQGIKSDFLNV